MPNARHEKPQHELSFHSLRHTTVSLMHAAGVSQAVSETFAGHSSSAVHQLYIHADREGLQRAADLLPTVRRRHGYKPEQPRLDIDIFDIFVEIFLRLRKKAEQGDARAFELLHWAGLNVGVFFFEIGAKGTPEQRQALRDLAAKHTVWPVVELFAKNTTDARLRLRRLGLGEKRIYDLESKVKPDPLTKLALGIIEEIDDVGSILRAYRAGEISTRPRLPMYSRTAARLPPFTRETLPQWWKVAAQIFDRRFPDPAEIPWMRALCKNGASKSAVRATVKKRLRQKLAGLARAVTQKSSV